MISEEAAYEKKLQHHVSKVIIQDTKRDVNTSVKHAPGAVRCASEQFQQCHCKPGNVIYFGDKYNYNGSNHVLTYKEML